MGAKENFLRPRPRIFVLAFFALAVVYYSNIGQICVTDGPSMDPTIKTNEYVYVAKTAFAEEPPAKDDVIALYEPEHFNIFIKRVAANAGDYVEVRSDGLVINGHSVKGASGPFKNKSYYLSSSEVFVLGDNKPASMDSRDFGPIKLRSVIGKVKAVIWPPSGWRLIK